MTYIDYMNKFWRVASVHTIPASEVAVYAFFRNIRPVRPATQTTKPIQTRVSPVTQPKAVTSFTFYNIDTPQGTKVVKMLNAVKDIFLNEAQIPEGNDAATSMSESCGGGGGSAPDSIWGKKDDEDDLKFARRCLNMAHSMRKTKSVKRGYYR